MKALLIDDEEPILEQAKIFLQKENDNLELVSTVSPVRAIELIKENSYDCVVCDYQMPELNGLEVLKKIREDIDSDIPFIIFTGKGREEVAMKALNQGANRYIQKKGDPKTQYGVLANAIVQEYERWKNEKEMKNALKRRAKVEHKISVISSRYAGDYDFDDITNKTLRDIGELVGASRAYLFLFRENGEKMDNTHEWCAENVSSQINKLKGLKRDKFSWWIKELKKKEFIHIKDVSEMPEEAEAEKNTLKEQNIRSVLVLPIYVDDELDGFIGFDDVEAIREWSEEAKFSLKIISTIIGKSLEKDITNKKLRESEEKYRILSEGSSDGIFVYQNNELKYLNEAFANLLDYSQDELKEKEFLDLIHLDYREKVKNFLEKTFEITKGDSSTNIEAKALKKDGEPIWVRLKFSVVDFEEKPAIVGTLSDITNQKKKELKLQDSLSRLETLMENQEVGILFENDNREILYANNKFCELFGIPNPESIIGKDCAESVKQSKKLFKEPEKFLNRIEELLNKSEPVKGEELKLKDGRVFLRDYIPVFSKERYIGHLWQYQDITNRKKSEKKFKKLFNASPDPTFLLDKNGVFKEINQAALDILGYKKDEIIGKTIKDVPFFSKEVKDKINKNLENRLNGEEIPPYSLKAETKNGDTLIVEINSTLIDEGEGFFRIIGVARDITEQKKAEEREKFLHSLLRHDVKNKISTIRGYLDLLDTSNLNEESMNYFIRAKEGIDEGIEIIEKVDTLRKAQKEKIKEVKACKVIKKVIDQLKNKEIDIDMECPKGCNVLAGPLLNQVFFNIIENSIQHSKGKTIKIRGENKENEVICSIEDDGVGIPDEEKERIFRKGYTTDENRGSGLGLFLAKKLIEIYGGKIEITDSELGGAKFDVHLKKGGK